jgi:hypothetical protein
MALPAPIVSMSATPSGHGYWMYGADGSVYPFGDAGNHGSMRGTRLNMPVVYGVSTRSGNGYWMCAGDGGIFSFGDAGFFGSTGNIHLNKARQVRTVRRKTYFTHLTGWLVGNGVTSSLWLACRRRRMIVATGWWRRMVESSRSATRPSAAHSVATRCRR